MDTIVAGQNRDRLLALLRVFWIALIVFLIPAFALGNDVAVQIDTLARAIAEARQQIQNATNQVTCPQNAANCRTQINPILRRLEEAANKLQTASATAQQNYTRQQEVLRSSRVDQASARTLCQGTNQAGATNIALQQEVRSLPEQIQRGTAALQPANLWTQVKQAGEQQAQKIQQTISNQNVAMQALTLNANGCGPEQNSLASLGGSEDPSREDREGERRNGNRESNSGGNSNLQMAALAMQGLGMLGNMFKSNSAQNPGGSQPSNTLDGFPTINNGPGAVPGDANGDGIPDNQQTLVQLGKAGNPNTVGFTSSNASTETPEAASALKTNSLAVIPSNSLPNENALGLLGSVGDSSTGGGSSGLAATAASMAGIGGGGGSSAEESTDATGASKMPVADEVTDDLSAGGKGLGGGGSMLGMTGSESSGFSDLMNSLKAPLEKPEDANKSSADFGPGEKGGLPKAGRDLASNAANDLNLTKDSLFVRVTDRLSLACERAELICKRTRRSQGEI